MTEPTAPAATSLTALMRGPWRLTPITLALVAVNVVVFVAMLAFGAGLWHTDNQVQLAWGANFGPATKDGEWWRLFTAMFLHFGVIHLGLNMWALWDSGRLVERLYGSPRFALLYLGSGLAGNLVSLVAQGDRAVSGGASGAIFGLYGAFLVALARERRHVDRHEFRWLFWGGGAFALVALGFGFVVPGIDNAAHLGGLGTGALLGVALARPLGRETPLAGAPRVVAGALLVLATALLATHIPAPRYRLGEELQARQAIGQFLSDERRISDSWQSIVGAGRRGEASFDELAGQIEADVSRPYQDSFEQLSSVSISPQAPSAANLQFLRQYAQARGDAAHALAEALRANDEPGIRRAMEAMRRATEQARSATKAASAAQPPTSSSVSAPAPSAGTSSATPASSVTP